MKSLTVVPIRVPRVQPGVNVMRLILNKLRSHRLRNAIVVVSSKLVSYDQGRVIPISEVSPNAMDRTWGKRYGLSAHQARIVRAESDALHGGVHGAVLTENDGILIANAGADTSNVPKNSIALWPTEPWKWAEELRRKLQPSPKSNIGVLINDSHCSPMRSGTTGVALAIAGFQGVYDVRGQRDLYGNIMHLTTMNLADDIGSAAHLLQGERDERTPLAIVRNAPVRFVRTSAKRLTAALRIDPHRDLFREWHASSLR